MNYTQRQSHHTYNILLLVGAMKAGTTTLWHYLCQHPCIVANVRRKEPHFFSSEERFNSGPQQYLNQYPNLTMDSWALDATTSYTKYPAFPNVPERISRFPLPARFKFIYILRNPFDRIESHLAHLLAKGRTQNIDHISPSSHSVQVSMYAMQLDRYYAALESPDFTLIDFEQLKTDPVSVCRTIETALHLPAADYQAVAPANRRPANDLGVQDLKLTQFHRDRVGEALGADINRLITQYDFRPARDWLRQP